MSRRSCLTRFVSWFAVAAMLLRMAVPMLAVGAAELRGVSVGSVCAVYGVQLEARVGNAHAGHGHHHPEPAGHDGHGSDAAHTGEHCALTALGELGVSHAPPIRAAGEGGHATAGLVRPALPEWGDASATWLARRKQGPPPVA